MSEYKVTKTLEAELAWLGEVINVRLKLYFDEPGTKAKSIEDCPAPKHNSGNPFSNFVKENNLGVEDRLLLILSIVPVIKPQLLDVFNIKNTESDQRFTEFGAVKGSQHNGLIPTLETLLFILAGDDIRLRLKYLSYFGPNHLLLKKKLIILNSQYSYEPPQSRIIVATGELLEILLKGQELQPEFAVDFPAKPVQTGMDWKDLVLEEDTWKQIEEIKTWMDYGQELLANWNLQDKLKPGYRCLFYGPPGTGKTLTATLLGKYKRMDVYRVDLSLIVSKYIGETEQNLAKVFDRAENRNWILFFDEADALFGKRTNVKDAHDRFANQEVSFLLQRVEDYNGLVILATNFKANIDDAFARRFQTVVNFPMPRAEQRENLWKNTFSSKMKLAEEINLRDIAKRYELSGGSIVNIVRYSSLQALKRNSTIIKADELLEGIKRELNKEGRGM